MFLQRHESLLDPSPSPEQGFNHLFEQIKEITLLWLETQNKWTFLRTTLTGDERSDDDQTHWRELHHTFNETDRRFRVSRSREALQRFSFSHMDFFAVEVSTVRLRQSFGRGIGQS